MNQEGDLVRDFSKQKLGLSEYLETTERIYLSDKPINANLAKLYEDLAQGSSNNRDVVTPYFFEEDRPLSSPIPERNYYYYNPDVGNPNDYYTMYPDQYDAQALNEKAPDADFRDPCAIHDVCYDAASRGERTQEFCDQRFHDQLHFVCEATYQEGTANRRMCNGRSDAYYQAVKNVPHSL